MFSFLATPLITQLGGALIEKLFPNTKEQELAKLKLLQMQQDGALREIEANFQLAIKQTEVNLVEAQSDSFFKSGWRPFVAWACGISFILSSLGLTQVLYALVAYFIGLAGFQFVPPEITMQDTFAMLYGLLGLGAYRTYEKTRK